MPETAECMFRGEKQMLYFIVNEKSRSGRGAQIWKEVQRELVKRGIHYRHYVTEHEGHATRLAVEICAKTDDDICLAVVGGDGTANEVINGITHPEKVRFGLIPTGSGNDLARGLKLSGTPSENLARMLSCMQRGREACTVIDLGEVAWDDCEKPRKFAISAGVGLDALVCKKALTSKLKVFLNKLHLGKLTYLLITVQSLFSMQTTEAAVRLDETPERKLDRIIYIAAMNFKAEGGGVPMAPKADATDGKLSICSVHGIPKWRTFLCLPFLVAAKHTGIRGFDIDDCGTCEVRLKDPMVLHADGEYCGDVTKLQFRCLPGMLRVLL